MKSKIRWLLSRNGLYTEFCAWKNKWPGHVTMGQAARIGSDSSLNRYLGGNITLGTRTILCKHCKLSTCGGDIVIGNDTTLGDYTTITAQGGVTVGDNVIFADHVSMIANEHNYEKIDVPIMKQGCYTAPIVIGDGSWIGINATILAGSHIGKNCVVAAGAVVKGTFPDYCVIGGVPAKIIKRYHEQTKQWE